MKRVLLSAIFAHLTCGSALPAHASEASPDEVEEALAYAWSNAMYTLYHEIGHMFIDQFSIPILSKEEDAADNLATLMLLEDYLASDDRIIEDAAYGWSLSSAWEESEIPEEWFYEEHSLDQQRAFTMVCLLVGSDKEAFGDFADDWGIDEERQDECQFDYEQAAESWSEVLEPFRRKRNAAGPQISVTYSPPEEGYEEIAEYLQEWELLETAAARVDSGYALPAPVSFRAAHCGENDAYYESSGREVIVCYEHVASHFDRYIAELLKVE